MADGDVRIASDENEQSGSQDLQRNFSDHLHSDCAILHVFKTPSALIRFGLAIFVSNLHPCGTDLTLPLAGYPYES